MVCYLLDFIQNNFEIRIFQKKKISYIDVNNTFLLQILFIFI